MIPEPTDTRVENARERIAFRVLVATVVAAAAVALGTTYQARGWTGVSVLASYAGASLLAVGKFVVFAGVHGDARATPWELASLVFGIDVGVAVFLAGVLASLERTRLFAGPVARARDRAVAVLARYPALERAAFLGVATLVLLPIAATGAVTGSFAARLAGLSRAAGVAAIGIGSAVASYGFATLAAFVGARAESLLKSPVAAGLSVAVGVAVGWWLYRRLLGRLRSNGAPLAPEADSN